MKHVVITGSTRGIGNALAVAFLERNCKVMISGRSQRGVTAALEALQHKYPRSSLAGQTCDVRQPEDLFALWDRAIEIWGAVDIWINNAGSSGPEAPIWQLAPDHVAAVIETNLLGTMYGCQAATRGMLAQGSGAMYNMEGMGSDGRMHGGLSSYGTSKYAISYFTRALAMELRDEDLLVGSLRPGMVITELITDQYRERPAEFERAKRIFNIIAERVETVAPWLVERMLSNKRTGVVISFSSRWKLMWRFMTSPFVKRDLFEDK